MYLLYIGKVLIYIYRICRIKSQSYNLNNISKIVSKAIYSDLGCHIKVINYIPIQALTNPGRSTMRDQGNTKSQSRLYGFFIGYQSLKIASSDQKVNTDKKNSIQTATCAYTRPTTP